MGMKQGQSRKRSLSCFATLLLLAQVLLAGAHVHLGGAPAHEALASASRDAADRPNGPAHHDEDTCPLCWGQVAAHSLLAPPAIELRIPTVVAAARPAPVIERLAKFATPNAFRPRAPPAASRA
jgi:hypothetical protein